jgi:dienelactone hydrolase
MVRGIVGLALCAIAGCTAVEAEPFAEVMQINYTFRGKNLDLRPVLHLPKSPGPHSAVVIINSSGGTRDMFFEATPKPFAEQGIATVLLDTFTPRGIVTTVYDQTQITNTEMNMDALAVLARLRSDPRFKPDKIAVMGHSRGAMSVYYMASAAWYGWAGLSDMRNFNAAIAISPDCALQFLGFMDVPALEFLAVMGEKDDWTPPAPCLRVFEHAKAEGKKVDIKMIANAYHTFSTRNLTYDPKLFSLQGCAADPLIYTSPTTKLVSSLAKRQVSLAEISQVCGRLGASTGGPRDALPEVLFTISTWLKTRGW